MRGADLRSFSPSRLGRRLCVVADSGDSWSSVVPCFLCSLGSGRSAVTLEGSAWLAREQGRVMPSGRGAPRRALLEEAPSWALGAASVKPAGRRSQGGADERHGTWDSWQAVGAPDRK